MILMQETLYTSWALRIDNGDFHEKHLMFTLLLISLREISSITIQQMKAEILSNRMKLMT